jgi:hypothetical protein
VGTIHPIVGVWRVKTIGAPFPYHMFAFHSDGTMQQSNPPAGNTETSDTAGMGVWTEREGAIKARFEEFRLDVKNKTVTRGVIDFTITVTGDTLRGDSQFSVYSVDDNSLMKGPLAATLDGRRVKAPKQ